MHVEPLYPIAMFQIHLIRQVGGLSRLRLEGLKPLQTTRNDGHCETSINMPPAAAMAAKANLNKLKKGQVDDAGGQNLARRYSISLEGWWHGFIVPKDRCLDDLFRAYGA